MQWCSDCDHYFLNVSITFSLAGSVAANVAGNGIYCRMVKRLISSEMYCKVDGETTENPTEDNLSDKYWFLS